MNGITTESEDSTPASNSAGCVGCNVPALLGKASKVRSALVLIHQSFQHACIRDARSIAARSAAIGSAATRIRAAATRINRAAGVFAAADFRSTAAVIISAAVAAGMTTGLAATTQPSHQGPTVTVARAATARRGAMVAAMIAAIVRAAARIRAAANTVA